MAKRRSPATTLGRPVAIAAAFAAGFFSAGTAAAQTPPQPQPPSALQRLLNEKEHRFSEVPLLKDRESQSSLFRYSPTKRPQPLPTQPVASPQPNRSAVIQPNADSSARQLIGQFKQSTPADLNRARVVNAAQSSGDSSANGKPQTANRNWQAPQLESDIIRGQADRQYTAAQTSYQTLAGPGDVDPSSQSQSADAYQLRNVDMKRFEQSVVNTFGSYLRASTSEDGRFVRVEIPANQGKPMTTLVDRRTGVLRYEGQPGLMNEWHGLMTQLDQLPRRKTDGSIETTEMLFRAGPEAKTLRQVVYLMTTPQDNGVQENDIPQAQLPGVDQIQNGSQDDPQGQEIRMQGLKKPVRIVESNGRWTLVGDPEDVAIVKRELARLAKEKQANQPVPVGIKLENVQASQIEERVQEIYNQSYQSIFGRIDITSVDNPNKLIAVGQPKGIEALRKLVAELDVVSEEKPEEGFKTFVLRYISAPDAERRLEEFFVQAGLTQGDNSLPSSAVSVIPDFRSNQVTVRGSSQVIRTAEAFLKTIDVDKVTNGAVNEVKVVRLKNTRAEEVALVLQDAVSGQLQNANQAFTPNGQTQQQNQQQQVQPNQSQLRSPALSLTTIGKDGRMLESAVMFDVRVTADQNSNSLIIAASRASMPLLMELVEQLDVIPNAQTEIKVFELVHGDAQTVVGMLESLFGANNQGGGNQGGNNLDSLPLQAVSATDGATLVNLRFTHEPYSNSVIASGPAGDLQVVESLLNRLDARALNHTKPEVYRLSNAPALDVADAINSYLDSRNDLIDADPRYAGVPSINRAVIVQPEVVSNSLIVSALPEYRQEMEDLIKALDRRPPMVKVKILIAEVDLNAVEEFGVELGIQDSLLFDRGTSVVGGAIDGIGFPFNSSGNAGTVPNANAFARELLAGQAVSQLGIGSSNSNLGYGGLVLSAGNESLSILMRALQDRQCVRVLSKPHITTMENLQGRVSIGASVPRIAGVVQNNISTTQDVIFQDVGVILEVTPRVSPDGMIVLSVNAEKSSVGPEETGIVIGFSSAGDPITTPQILKTEATTTLMARSGQTVVFSGLIDEQKTHIERGAPILSDLPVIGPLFKFESDSSSRRELLIIMTPELITDDQDLVNANQDEMDRMHWCLTDVAEVYGNTGYGGFSGVESAVETYYPDQDPTGLVPATDGTIPTQGAPVIMDSRLNSPDQKRLSKGGDIFEDASNGVFENRGAAGSVKTASEKPRRGLFSRRR